MLTFNTVLTYYRPITLTLTITKILEKCKKKADRIFG